jgi:hypothetical protein
VSGILGDPNRYKRLGQGERRDLVVPTVNDSWGTVKDIARDILKYDDSQVEYYEHITRQMPGKVLASPRSIQFH